MTEIVLSPINISAPMVVEAARAAEAAGFEAIWTYDHISGISFGGRPVLDSWTVLAAVATHTTRVADRFQNHVLPFFSRTLCVDDGVFLAGVKVFR